jgi:hypothetical protein
MNNIHSGRGCPILCGKLGGVGVLAAVVDMGFFAGRL